MLHQFLRRHGGPSAYAPEPVLQRRWTATGEKRCPLASAWFVLRKPDASNQDAGDQRRPAFPWRRSRPPLFSSSIQLVPAY